MEGGRDAFKVLTGKRPLGRPSCRWGDNIRIDLKGMCQYEKVDSFGSG